MAQIRPRLGEFTTVKTSKYYSDKIGHVTEVTKLGCTVQYPGGAIGKYNWEGNEFTRMHVDYVMDAPIDDVINALETIQEQISWRDSLPVELLIATEYYRFYRAIRALDREHCKIDYKEFVEDLTDDVKNSSQRARLKIGSVIESAMMPCNYTDGRMINQIEYLCKIHKIDYERVQKELM